MIHDAERPGYAPQRIRRKGGAIKQQILSIGVTGHRSLADERPVAAAVHEILGRLRRDNPDRPLRVLSSLAEGADRLVARVAIDDFQAELYALLPMPADRYCDDFTAPASRAGFRELLARATRVEEEPARGSREAGYVSAGAAIAGRCDVLIAVWDGLPARGSGGTADVVQRARTHGADVYWIKCGTSVSWSVLKAESDEGMPTMPPNRTPHAEARTVDRREWERMLGDCREAVGEGVTADVVGDLEVRYRTVVDHFGPDYDQAEAKANVLQTGYRRASTAVGILAAVAVLIATVQALFHFGRWLSAGEVVAIALILLIFHFGDRRDWHVRWMESRLEAEWIRQAIFVAFLSGSRTPGIDRHWSCRWVRDTDSVRKVRELWEALPAWGPPPAAGLPFLREFMAGAWLKRQREYHQGKERSEAAKHRRISRAGEFFFWATFLAAIGHTLPSSAYHALHVHEHGVAVWLTLVCIGLPTIAAALTGLRCHFEYQKISSRSAMMADHLLLLEEELRGVTNLEELAQLVRETETLMLQENADWYFMIGQHHIEKV